MFAHQVIDDILSNDLTKKIFEKEYLDIISNGILSSQSFHFGDIERFRELLTFKDSKTIIKEEISRLKLPYNSMWSDFTCSKEGAAKKFGILALKKHDRLTIISVVYNHIDKFWHPLPCLTDLPISDDSICFEHGFRSGVKKVFIHLFEDTTQPEEDHFQDLLTLILAIKLIGCKNIGTINNPPPQALNKKRLKSGKQPLFTYKTLIIKPTGKKQESQAAQGLWDNRVHLCRGHFKTYTDKNPLFGRVTGRFWWQPAVRGNKEKGVVMKDYVVMS